MHIIKYITGSYLGIYRWVNRKTNALLGMLNKNVIQFKILIFAFPLIISWPGQQHPIALCIQIIYLPGIFMHTNTI